MAASDLTAPVSPASEPSDDPLDDLLTQVIHGYFLLTDGTGAVSKWSESAELLFGREPDAIVGEQLFGNLIAEPLPPAADCWRQFLEQGTPPVAPGRVEVMGTQDAAGSQFPMELHFVPVKLDEVKPNTGQIFKFGSRPAILVRTEAGELRAFSAVCTHLNCTVQYRADLGHIWCACHNGHFDLKGQNIGGPPPRPLDAFVVNIRGTQIVVSKNA